MVQQLADTERGTLIQSVQRAASLLKVFGHENRALGVSELSRLTHLHKSTVSRLLATLEHEGLIERAPASDKYQLGFELVRLAGHVTHFNDLRAAAQPVLLHLAAQSRETVNLAVLDGDEAVNVEQIDGPHIVRDSNWVGRRTPLHCVANGKVLLAWRSPTTVDRIVSQPLMRFTTRTITDPELLRDELERVRTHGYATALGEIEDGLNAVAAPVRAASGEIVAAISVSGPAYRVTVDRIVELGALTLRAAEAISARWR